MPESNFHLRHRKAFELCAAVNVAILDQEADAREPHLETAREKARTIASDEIHVPQDTVSLEDFFRASMAAVVCAAEDRAGRYPPSPTGARALSQLKRFAPPGDPCRMRIAFDHCAAAAMSFYDAQLPRGRAMPGIAFEIQSTGRRNEAFPGWPTAFNASVTFNDTPDGAKSSLLTLKVLPTVLECSCFEMLPYIITHELVCHWPQMAGCRQVRPNPECEGNPTNVDGRIRQVDPFSEGWMDSLVAEVLGWRCRDGRSSAAWNEEVDTAIRIHKIRTNATSPTTRFADAPRIAIGRKAARYVKHLYEQDSSAFEMARRDFLRLSCALNFADWTYSQRRSGCEGMFEACEACEATDWDVERMSGKPAAIIRSLLAFRVTSDADPVLEAITGNKYTNGTVVPNEVLV